MSFGDLPFFSSGGGAGETGKDGVSPTISVEDISGGHRLTIIDATGRKTVDVMNGTAGPQGEQGIQGEKGETGAAGQNGANGKDGQNGKDGKSALEYAQSVGYSGTETVFAETLANAVDKRNIAIGVHSDGLLYLFIDGSPVGTGIALQAAPETTE